MIGSRPCAVVPSQPVYPKGVGGFLFQTSFGTVRTVFLGGRGVWSQLQTQVVTRQRRKSGGSRGPRQNLTFRAGRVGLACEFAGVDVVGRGIFIHQMVQKHHTRGSSWGKIQSGKVPQTTMLRNINDTLWYAFPKMALGHIPFQFLTPCPKFVLSAQGPDWPKMQEPP